jgi:hypothetical protein
MSLASDEDLLARQSALQDEARRVLAAEQRSAVLRIKDNWYRQAAYPHQVGGRQIYTAVIDNGIRTPDQFAAWLAQHGLPVT